MAKSWAHFGALCCIGHPAQSIQSGPATIGDFSTNVTLGNFVTPATVNCPCPDRQTSRSVSQILAGTECGGTASVKAVIDLFQTIFDSNTCLDLGSKR